MSDPWEPVILRKKKATPKTNGEKKSVAAAAQRAGTAVSVSKYAAGTNKQKDGLIGSAKKLDEDTEHVVHKKVPLSLGKTIQQARAAKGMTQKDLAQKINEKPHVVNEYEAGKAIPDQTILGKLERQLGVKLRGKDIGAPLPARGAKKKAAGKK
mmetsp:Transcript_14837/g.46500  ORF Transcript_14837/g.46500 Transcript_14837/m.46500 type:complete len:154 (+) Transcript_14837:84-545(+)